MPLVYHSEGHHQEQQYHRVVLKLISLWSSARRYADMPGEKFTPFSQTS